MSAAATSDAPTPARLRLPGIVRGTTVVIERQEKPFAPFSFQMFQNGKLASLAFACGEDARITVGISSVFTGRADVQLWIGHACVYLRHAEDARRVAKALDIPMPALPAPGVAA